MARYLLGIALVPLLAGVVFIASGQAPAKPRGALAILTAGMPVSLTDTASGYEIGTFAGGFEGPLGHTVVDVGPEFVVLEDISGIRQIRIPIYAVKGVVTTTLKPPK